MSTPDAALTIHQVAAGAMAERTVAVIDDRLGAGAKPADVAVLARVNSALLPVQVALTEAGVPHTAPLDATVLGRTGIRTALAYLRMGLDLERIRREDIFDTINRPARKVKSAVQPLLKGNRFSIRQLEQVAGSLDGTHQDRFAGYLGDLRHLEQAITDEADTARCLWIVRNRIGLGEAMDALDASRTRPEGSSHGDDLDALEQLALLQPDPAAFRDWLVDRLRVPSDPDGVTLSTVHRVKGMEWDHVVVFAVNQGLFPHRLADDDEEERRVFHVAVTRCRVGVAVVADRDRVSGYVAELARATDRKHAAATTLTALPDEVAVVRLPDGAVAAVPGLAVSVPGGLTGRIAEVDGGVAVVDAVLAAHVDEPGDAGDPVRLRVAFGSPVTVAGERTRLGPPPRPGRSGAADRGGVAGRSGAADGAAGRGNGGAGGGSGGGAGGSGGGVGGSGRLDIDLDDVTVDDALYDALRAWRSRIAAEHGVPAYLVFHDRHLQLIAGRKPETLRDLAACPGVGPTKLERYGDDVLDLVADHL